MDDPFLKLFATIFMAFICCGTPLLLAGIVYGFAINAPRKKAAVKQLAEQMGLTPNNTSRRGERYVGEHQGHTFDIGLGVKRSAGTNHYSHALQVVLELEMTNPLRGYAGCNRKPGPEESFEKAFGKARLGMEGLPALVEDKLLAFARKYDNVRLEGISLDKEPSSEGQPKMTLEHTMARGVKESPEEVRTVLDEMVNVARVVVS